MQPFEGIRVIDMTHVFAGPFSTYQLAVLGADVIKVEAPNNPDMTRQGGVNPALNEAYYGTAFMAQNGGKRAISLDIKTPRGKEILLRLVETADVLVENYQGGSLDRLGLGYDDLSSVNPQLIYCSITGFGHTGPKRADPAYDIIVQAFSGAMAMNGETDSPPVRIGPPMVDYGTGSQAALAISSALFQRERTGKGQRIDVAMLDAALMMMSAIVTGTATNGKPQQSHGNADLNFSGYASYPTRDGMLMLGAFTKGQLGALFRVLGDPARAEAVEATPRSGMGARREEDAAFLRAAFAKKPADEWEAILISADVPAARVRTLDETLAEAQTASRAVLQEYPGAAQDGMPPALPVAAYAYAHGGPKLNGPPPKVGEHTGEILTELGFTAHDIAEFETQGIVTTKPPPQV